MRYILLLCLLFLTIQQAYCAESPNDLPDSVVNEAREKVKKIEALFSKYQGWIPLKSDPVWQHKGESIEAMAPTQELWAEMMGQNPSYFKERKYCPRTYQEIGQTDSMCSDFPVDHVSADNSGKKISDAEFIAELNQLYKAAGLAVQFRRPYRFEYDWADTEGGIHPKRASDPQLSQSTPFWEISDLSPSGEHQPRSVFENAPNAFGFRRSGMKEWVEDLDPNTKVFRGLAGGSWRSPAQLVESGVLDFGRVDYQDDFIGASRLVRSKTFLEHIFIKIPKGIVKGDSYPYKEEEISSFEVSKFPITREFWFEIMGSLPTALLVDGSNCPNCPITHVAWEESKANGYKPAEIQFFLAKLNERERAAGCTYDLPTDSQIYYMIRGDITGTNKDPISKGITFENAKDYLNYWSSWGAGKLLPVGSKKPNAFGIELGNVYKLPKDRRSYDCVPIRGGSWANSYISSSDVYCSSPGVRKIDAGFVLVRTCH